MNTLDEHLLMRLPADARPLMRFVCTRMVHSYKPVLAQIFLRRLPQLSFPFSEIAAEFVDFYRERIECGLPVERVGCPFVTQCGLDEERAIHTAAKILYMIFARGHGMVSLAKGVCSLLPGTGWTSLSTEPFRDTARALLEAALERFYNRISDAGEAIYVQQQPSAGELVFYVSDTDDEWPLLVLRTSDDEVSE